MMSMFVLQLSKMSSLVLYMKRLRACQNLEASLTLIVYIALAHVIRHHLGHEVDVVLHFT